MSIEIRELKIKGFINKENQKNSNSISPEFLRALKRDIKKECKSEIIRYLEKQNRR